MTSPFRALSGHAYSAVRSIDFFFIDLRCLLADSQIRSIPLFTYFGSS